MKLSSDNPAHVCCASLNRTAKANGFFLVNLPLPAVSPRLLCPPCPLHPSVHPGTSAEVGRAGGSWTGSRALLKERERVEKAELINDTRWCAFITDQSSFLTLLLLI